MPANHRLDKSMEGIFRGCGELFISSDPEGKQLGSGGGTAWLLHEAWKQEAEEKDGSPEFGEWLHSEPRLLVHGCGESRRLPAYAPVGKPLITVPELADIPGQFSIQYLINIQCRRFRAILKQAPSSYCLMTCCGDTLVLNRDFLPGLPEVDVLIFGLQVAPEEASRHGVVVTGYGHSGEILRFLQKPSVDELDNLGRWETYLLDSGMWMFSSRAVNVLMEKCGWDFERSAFRNSLPDTYDIYNEFGRSLGSNPGYKDPDILSLTSAVVLLDQAAFYHFGTNRSMISSCNQLKHPEGIRALSPESLERLNSRPIVLHSEAECEIFNGNRYIWIDNSVIPPGWDLSERHVLTNIPSNNWRLKLPPGSCLDFQLVGGSWYARNYGFDDGFKGDVNSAGTEWMGCSVPRWMEERGMSLEDAGIEPSSDILDARLFPEIDLKEVSGDFIQWLFTVDSAGDAGNEIFRRKWLESPRITGRDLLRAADFRRPFKTKLERIKHEVRTGNRKFNLELYDLQDIAGLVEDDGLSDLIAGNVNGLNEARYSMLLSEMARLKGNSEDAVKNERSAFSGLRKLLIDQLRTDPQSPAQNVQEDQIVWGRSPIRFDLAGGWTDTPPYCISYGGKVVNFAADLNGQSPIQVFARISKEPRILLRSLDLGLDEKIETFDELLARDRLGGGFGIARASLELVGFSPEFNVQSNFRSLRHLLETSIGGGIELSMVAALPKGSGLGTSSILAATILGTLGEICGLNWSREDVYFRTMAVEQMMNLGGGWQDQVGGMYPGLKLISSQPGKDQEVTIRTLPGICFDNSRANVNVLLYYTGITRVARNILAEVVRGIFLNDAGHMCRLREIGMNALFAADALQRGDMELISEAVRRSWKLKKALDPGSSSPEINRIEDMISPYARACMLGGAGGGGYLLIFANDVQAAGKIRSLLQGNPPNNKARFVDFALSDQGFQISRS